MGGTCTPEPRDTETRSTWREFLFMFSMISTVSTWIGGEASTELSGSPTPLTVGDGIIDLTIPDKYQKVSPKQLEIGVQRKFEAVEYSKDPGSVTTTSGMKKVLGLVGVWFMTIAAGSVLCSIPLAVATLPFVCVVAICILAVGAFLKWVFALWLAMVKYCLVVVRDIVLYPRHLVSKLSSWIGSYFSIGYKNEQAKSQLRVKDQLRAPRMYKLERYRSRKSDYGRQDEYNMRLYQSGKPPVDTSRGLSNRHSFDLSRQPLELGRRPSSDLSSIGRNFKDQSTVRNPQFLFLTPDDEFRLSLCSELYASSTNMKPEDFLIRLGRDEDGQIHYVLSIWDEPTNISQLNLDSIIGFCEVI